MNSPAIFYLLDLISPKDCPIIPGATSRGHRGVSLDERSRFWSQLYHYHLQFFYRRHPITFQFRRVLPIGF